MTIDRISVPVGAGCDFVVCSANSNYIVYENGARQSDIQWISIVETGQSAAPWSSWSPARTSRGRRVQ